MVKKIILFFFLSAHFSLSSVSSKNWRQFFVSKTGETPLDKAHSKEMQELLRKHGALTGQQVAHRNKARQTMFFLRLLRLWKK